MFDVGQTRRTRAESVSVEVCPDARLDGWNRTQADYPSDLCIHDLIEAQAARTPQAPAVAFHDGSLTYAELVARSNQFARYLQQRGVQSESLVGLCLERSHEMPVALLGILKAGAAYVPLDPMYPQERIKHVLEDSRVRLLITHQRVKDALPQLGAETVCIDSDWREIEKSAMANLDGGRHPTSLAYVIYTSGSTGKPKGVQIEHRSVVNFLTSMQRCPGMTGGDVLVAVTTLSFDIAGLEMYLPLISGGTVAIADRETTQDGRKLASLLQATGATVMQATPATWRLLIESGWRGDRKLKVLCGGEALSADLARELVARAGSVWNLYGPTETTIWSSVYQVTGEEKGTVPIGQPIANTQFHVVDAEMRTVPVGQDGELLIGGDGLARGYFERPELTREKFVENPFEPGTRLYRTGDLARFREDGVVEFLGRIDHQVKIRGFRIELGEIEAVLEKHAAVRQAIVTAREDNGDKRLVAYVVPTEHEGVAPAEMHDHLKRYVPEYMVPSAFVVMDRLPLTPNGKVDRKALPAPHVEDYCTSTEYAPPRDPVEQKLCVLWEEVLQIRPIGVTTNLLELGAHSLQIARAFMKMSKSFGRDLPLALIFQASTIEQLASMLRPGKSQTFPTLVAVQPKGSKVPLFCVHGGAGTALYLHKLASYLGADQPVYGLESEGLDGKRIHRRTVEQMAAHYINEIRTVQGRGPYLLGGYCFGGIVAYEMARQLTATGEQAEFVALLNTPLRFNRLRTPIANRTADMQPVKLQRRGLARAQAAMAWRVKRVLVQVRAASETTLFSALPALGIAVPQSLRTPYVLAMTEQAEREYQPKTYRGKLSIFRGRGVYDHDPELGWSDLAAGGLEIYDIGDNPQEGRREMINEPVVGKLGRELRNCLERLHVERQGESREVAQHARNAVVTANWAGGSVVQTAPPT